MEVWALRQGPTKITVQELEPGAWAAFERAVDTVVKGGPQHKTGKSTGEMKVGDDAHDKRDRGNRRSDDRGS